MPATEQTYRSQKLLHRCFAATGVILLIATIWMFWADHAREWKVYQSKARDIELQVNEWRQIEYTTTEAQAEVDRLNVEVVAAKSMPIKMDAYDAFKEAFAADYARRYAGEDAPAGQIEKLKQTAMGEFTSLDADVKAFNEKAAAAQKLRDKVADIKKQQEEAAVKAKAVGEEAKSKLEVAPYMPDPKKATAEAEALKKKAEDMLAESKKLASVEDEAIIELRNAEQEAAPLLQPIINQLNGKIAKAKFREDQASLTRKFKSAELDALKGKLGLALSGGESQEVLDELQAEIDKKTATEPGNFNELTAEYQALETHRKKLDAALNELTAAGVEAEKQLADAGSRLQRLQTAYEATDSDFFELQYPGLGKKLLELPILDAFNGPLKIDNLWNSDVTIDYNFRRVRRFDRCTTCHHSMQKTQPGSAVEPAYEHEHTVELLLQPPAPEEQVDADVDNPLLAIYGLQLAQEGTGLIDSQDVTVAYVAAESRAAKATIAPKPEVLLQDSGEEIRRQAIEQADKNLLQGVKDKPGLMLGDVIVAINGDTVRSPADARRFLMNPIRIQQERELGAPVQVTVRRGLPHPYTSHPRLDLFVGSLSPHNMTTYGCTICHEGQGSATTFKWASHTPNSPEEMKRWAREHGWIDNHHWIYPQHAKRFQESTCLKCHHEVVELEPSERFPQDPAPKLMNGYNLIRKYGCYGCHEVNGYDGPDTRVGPDMRAEPNIFAAAQQLMHDKDFEKLDEGIKEDVRSLVHHPENDEARANVFRMLGNQKEAAKKGEATLSYDTQDLEPLFKESDTPGTLRKPGPSLRYIADKVDAEFLYDWIRRPADSRPSTRMPQFFGLWDHLDDETRKETAKLESIEILAMSTYLLDRSQPFENLKSPLEQPANLTEDQKTAQIQSGKYLFQTKGCLACHSHEAFPKVGNYYDKHEIQQGPDLSNMPEKFDPARNPKGAEWLYTWIKEPTRYHVRTYMPNTLLNVYTDEKTKEKIDPITNIVAFLTAPREDGPKWQPTNTLTAFNAAGEAKRLDKDVASLLDEVTEMNLVDAYFKTEAERIAKEGISADKRAGLKGAEIELIFNEGEDPADPATMERKKLLYVGRKAIAKYGCYGCHDIPGFEGAKPIGAGLADWGRKDPSKLAFEHIHQYLHHGDHGHGGHGHDEGEEHEGDDAAGHADSGASDSDHPEEAGHDKHDDIPMTLAAPREPVPGFYMDQINAGNRTGFIFQKLREPRSYDYHKTDNKKYNERLRMPLFPFDDGDREAIITFVLGLVADPPAEKLVYSPSPRQKAMLEGKKVLEKYNCGGCHILEAERWELSFKPGTFDSSQNPKEYPWLKMTPTEAAIADSLAINRRGERTGVLHGNLAVREDGLPDISDYEGDALDNESNYSRSNLQFNLNLTRSTLLDGNPQPSGSTTLRLPRSMVDRRYPAHGGVLTHYLLGAVSDGNETKGNEAWAYVPPSLVDEGKKVQTEWLHDFLLDPQMIRPAVMMRMPKFNMSSEEASKLVNYFAARDGADFPYEFANRRRPGHLEQLDKEYQQRLAKLEEPIEAKPGVRMQTAADMLVDRALCVKCHLIGDYNPVAAERTKGPNLANVYKRLRPEYVRRWVANPKLVHGYTAMPALYPHDPDQPFNGGVSQSLYHGTATQQIDALVDMLMNYDQYTRSEVSMKERAAASEAAAKAAEAAAAGATDEAPEDEDEDEAEVSPIQPAKSEDEEPATEEPTDEDE